MIYTIYYSIYFGTAIAPKSAKKFIKFDHQVIKILNVHYFRDSLSVILVLQVPQ